MFNHTHDKRSGYSPLGIILGLVTIAALVLAACAPTETSEGGAEPAAEATEPAEEEAGSESMAEATEPAEEEAESESMAEATEPAEEEAESESMAEATEPAEEEAGTDDMMMMGDPVAGQYIALQTGGCGCHNNQDLGGLAGGFDFETPTGVVYAPNITPDEETGIGSWSEEEIAHALHTGATPSGRQLHPVMPYMRFSALSHKEALDIGAWLKSLEPLANEVAAPELSEDPAPYTPAVEPPAEPPTDPVARGEQLVTLANCGGCHTPSDEDGNPMEDMMLAGAPLRDSFASNITPHEETGIGSWSEEEIATLLQTGTRPDGEMVEGAMASQIERRFHQLTDDDAAAIAAYLKTIPAVENARPAE